MVSVLGEPNVGKSTLVNALVGWKVSIVSPKPQTTWYPVRGVVDRPDGQVVLVDTPGFVASQPRRIPVAIRKTLDASLKGIDAVLRVADPTRGSPSRLAHLETVLRDLDVPRIAAVNKIDVATETQIQDVELSLAGYAAVRRVSALQGDGLGPLAAELVALLPQAAPLYPPETRTDLPLDRWIAELIRESLFAAMEEELPYTATVRVGEMGERPNGMLYVGATIRVAHRRQRGLFIGAGGRKIREIGSAARESVEAALGRKVFLDLKVKERRG
jgi:GTP-binding protein Era